MRVPMEEKSWGDARSALGQSSAGGCVTSAQPGHCCIPHGRF